jgi:hypothetical protein
VGDHEAEIRSAAAEVLAGPVLGVFFRPRQVGAGLDVGDRDLTGWTTGITRWWAQGGDRSGRRGERYVTGLPRLVYLAVAAERVGLFEFGGRRGAEIVNLVFTAGRDEVTVQSNVDGNSAWLNVTLPDGSIPALVAVDDDGPTHDLIADLRP